MRGYGAPAIAAPPGVAVVRVDDAEAPTTIDAIERHAPDAVLVAGFLQILRGPLLDRYAGSLFNSHPSPLPRFRGASPTFWAIATGATESGVTIHQLTRRVDGGPIVASVTVPTVPDDTEASLAGRIRDALPGVVGAFGRAVADPTFDPRRQDESDASSFPPARAADRRIAWQTMGAVDVERRVRAANGRAVTRLGPLPVWVRRARPVDGAPGGAPGTVVAVDRAGGPAGGGGIEADVVTADGIVRIAVTAPKGIRAPLRAGTTLR